MKLGNLAQYILDKRVPLEICLNSNVHTGAIDKLENHPSVNYMMQNLEYSLIRMIG